MARIRTIKPEFFQSDSVAELSISARVLFIGLWTLADVRGRLEDKPKKIKIQIFPYDNVDVDQLLTELVTQKMIVRYQGQCLGNDVSIIQVTNFEKHQKITGKESYNESLYSEYDRGSNGETTGKLLGNSREAPENLPESQEGKGKERKGKELLGSSRLEAPLVGAPPPTATPELDLVEPSFTLPTNTGEEFPIWPAQVLEFQKTYPAIDVEQSIREARSWCLSNPRKRKTKSGMLKFLNRWLSQDQNDPKKHRIELKTQQNHGHNYTRREPHVPIQAVHDRDRRYRERHGIGRVHPSQSGVEIGRAHV